jgi:hypothetical protein
VHPARRAAAARLLDQACRNIVHADDGRNLLLYRYAGALGLFGNAIDLEEAGARLLAAMHDSGWPGPHSSTSRKSPKRTIEAGYKWARKREAVAGDQP